MEKMKIMRLSLLLLILVGWAAQARTEGLPVKDLPPEGKSLVDFLPKGWTVEDQVNGDLNGDGVSDIAAILVQGEPDSAEDEPQRALIVLLGRDKEKFVLAGTNNKLLECKGCCGIKEGVGISIKKGVIVVEQMSGSREFSNETWRFRYDPQTQRFVLIGRDLETGDGMRGTGTIESFNFLTGSKITETYRYDKNGERKIATSTKTEKATQKTPFIEDVESNWMGSRH
ncbi:MAG: hypothetical protein ABSF52_12355 [Syntrophobacteraceae bacterium]|jgi:hypothetical protein